MRIKHVNFEGDRKRAVYAKRAAIWKEALFVLCLLLFPAMLGRVVAVKRGAKWDCEARYEAGVAELQDFSGWSVSDPGGSCKRAQEAAGQ